MKKLLSLLSVLTISGSAVPTTIAASPYQKQENLNNKNNYQQIKKSNIIKRQEPATYPILENIEIDLRNSFMKKPMEFQVKPYGCVIAILQNIFNNNTLNDEDVKKLTQEEIEIFFPQVVEENGGIDFEEVINMLNTNTKIKDSLGYNFKYVDFSKQFWGRLNNLEKKMWIRSLIWESLSRQISVPIGGVFSDDAGNAGEHAALIVGMKPNKENILNDTYHIRNPWRRFDADFDLNQSTETTMTGEQLFNTLLPSSTDVSVGDILIHEDAFSLFCQKAVDIFSTIWEMAEPELLALI